MSKTFVFKFGGASVKDASSIQNLRHILSNRLRNPTVVVVSAMGKTTNALEEILAKRFAGEDFSSKSATLKNAHMDICSELFENGHRVFSVVENYFSQLDRYLDKELGKENYDEYYDQVVSFGEMVSSRIVQEYLCESGLFCVWQDAREIIRTNADFRFAKVDWEVTGKLCRKTLRPILEKYPVITQGFVGRETGGKTTTLGREGSDFSAAILAAVLKATSVTIWKDVDGVLNADPKLFADTVKFDELDYREAAELTYYGASVIHPKTIKPLANLGIPLIVKSFLHPEGSGTRIHQVDKQHALPCIVVKKSQILVSFKVTDFTFINEGHIHQVFVHLEHLKLRVNLLQTSAISISIVIDQEIFKLEKLISTLQKTFDIKYNEGLQLLTVKNYKPETISELILGREILLEQITRTTFQIVGKNLVS